jgi:hypothetical protein
MRTCIKCKTEKSDDEFGRDSHKKDGVSSTCKQCKRDYFREYLRGNSAKHAEAARKSRQKLRERPFVSLSYDQNKQRAIARKHGLSYEEFLGILNEQGQRCAICWRTGEEVLPWHIDHDHSCCPTYSCGRCVRGILCASCNIGIGFFKNDPVRLAKAAQYLRAGRQSLVPPEI